MHVVHLQLDLFPHKLLTDDSVMEDFDRDCRSGPQWLRAVLAYLDFGAGDRWRRLSDPLQRWHRDRLWYLSGIQTINNVIAGRSPKWEPFLHPERKQPQRSRPAAVRRHGDRVA
jgi:hypothetical protein